MPAKTPPARKTAKKTTAKKTTAKKTTAKKTTAKKTKKKAAARSKSAPALLSADVEPEQLSAEAIAIHRAEAAETDAEAAVDGRETPHAAQVAHALRWVDPREPYVMVTSTAVVGSGPLGAALVPWTADLGSDVRIVDGRTLARALKSAGSEARLSATAGSLTVSSPTGRRFVLRHVDGTKYSYPEVPTDAAWQTAPAALFIEAARFAGDDKMDPPVMRGINLGRHGTIAATDRSSFYLAQTDAIPQGFSATLPRNAFDGLEGQVYVYQAKNQFWICHPTTGEYRMAVPYADVYPDVISLARATDADFTISLDRRQLVEAVRAMAIVQRRTSSVLLDVGIESTGAWFVEMRAQDPTASAEMTTRLHAVDLDGDPPADGLRVYVGADNLLRLASVSPDPETVKIGFGSDNRSPLVAYDGQIKAVAAVMLP